jgi:hypothetical protein
MDHSTVCIADGELWIGVESSGRKVELRRERLAILLATCGSFFQHVGDPEGVWRMAM